MSFVLDPFKRENPSCVPKMNFYSTLSGFYITRYFCWWLFWNTKRQLKESYERHMLMIKDQRNQESLHTKLPQLWNKDFLQKRKIIKAFKITTKMSMSILKVQQKAKERKDQTSKHVINIKWWSIKSQRAKDTGSSWLVLEVVFVRPLLGGDC